MKLSTWESLGMSNERALKDLVAPHNKELFHLELSAYSTVVAVCTLKLLFDGMEGTPEIDKLFEMYEEQYTKILKRIEGLAWTI